MVEKCNAKKIAELLPKYSSKVVLKVNEHGYSIDKLELLVLYVNDYMSDLKLAKALHDDLKISYVSKNGGYANMNRKNPYRFRLNQDKIETVGAYTDFGEIDKLVVIDYDNNTGEYEITEYHEKIDNVTRNAIKVEIAEMYRKIDDENRRKKNIENAYNLWEELSHKERKNFLETYMNE